MCFHIQVDAKPWTKRIVYKVLEGKSRNKVKFESPFQQKEYRLGRTERVEENAVFSGQFTRSGRANAGLYVYGTLKEAIADAKRNGPFEWNDTTVVVACKVSPRDFLYTDGSTQATYRAITPMKIVFRVKATTES